MTEHDLSERIDALDLAAEAGSIRSGGEARDLSAREMKQELLAGVDRRYRGLASRFQQAEAGDMIDRQTYAHFMGRLRRLYAQERGGVDFDRVLGPERPTRRQLETLIESLGKNGQKVVGIRSERDYQLTAQGITGILQIRDGSTQWTYPLVNDIVFKKIGDSEEGQTIVNNFYYVEAIQIRDGKLYGVIWGDFHSPDQDHDSVGVPIVAGKMLTDIDGYPILDVRTENNFFDHRDQFNGIITTLLPGDRRRDVPVIGGRVQREFFGYEFDQEHSDVEFLRVHDDGTVSTLYNSEAVYRNEVIKEIDGRPIVSVISFEPDEKGYSGIFELRTPDGADLERLCFVHGQRFDPFPDADLEKVEEFTIHNDQPFGVFRWYDRNRIITRVIANGKILPIPELEDDDSDTVVDEFSVSEEGLPSAVIKWFNETGDPSYRFLVDGQLVDEVAGISGSDIEQVNQFSVYDGAVNMLVHLKGKDLGEQMKTVLLDQVVD